MGMRMGAAWGCAGALHGAAQGRSVGLRMGAARGCHGLCMGGGGAHQEVIGAWATSAICGLTTGC